MGGDYWRPIAFGDQTRRDPSAAAKYAAIKAQRPQTRGKHEVVKIERAAGVDVSCIRGRPNPPMH
jgi:hypothetical protein